MKTIDTFFWTFIDTLIYNIATIAAIVVGLSQFLIRAWNENNCSEKVRQFLIQTLRLINASIALIYENLNHEVPAVTVRKVAQKRTKRR